MRANQIGPFIKGREPFKLTNLFGTKQGNMYVVFSYGRHWPLAVYHPQLGWLVNESQSTKTTAKHRGQVVRHIDEGFDHSSVTYLRNLIGA